MQIETKRLVLTGEQNGEITSFIIRTIPDNVVIGSAILRTSDRIEEGQISIQIEEAYRNLGYGTEAVKAVVWQVFENAGLDALSALVEPGNLAAKRMLDKVGFVSGADKWRMYHTDFLAGPEWELKEAYKPEPMGAFFDTRADIYDEHMFSYGGGTAYPKIGACVPKTDLPIEILDIGCGTGIELEYIWKNAPNARITCVDLSRGMLDLLLQKYADHVDKIAVVVASYVDWTYPEEAFDIVVSSATMHHFWEEEKVGIYRKILGSLKPGGAYIESDFIVDEACAEQYRRRFEMISSTLGAAPKAGEYHIDIPFTIDTQTRLLRAAGFRTVEVLDDDVKPRWSNAILKAIR